MLDSNRFSRVSVVIPAYNCAGTIVGLIDSLKRQSRAPLEIIVIDDHSRDETADLAQSLSVKVLRNSRNIGPAFCRNRGIQESKGEILAFVDSDCICELDWVQQIEHLFENDQKDVVMGKVCFYPQTNFSRAVCDLGWPAGGTVGFEKVWKIGADSRTDHISSCNFAVRRRVIEKYGAFDERFPLFGEDVELSERWVASQVRIYYCPALKVEHTMNRDSLTDFIRWHFYRGRSYWYLQKAIVRGRFFCMVKDKLWIHFFILVGSLKTLRFYLVIPLMILMYLCQAGGYVWENRKVK